MTERRTKEIRDKIDLFRDYVCQIDEIEPNDFDSGIYQRLARIDALSAQVPANTAELKKYCFDIVSEALDESIMHRHSRHKPLGYPGDYLLIDYIYSMRSDSQGNGNLWDQQYHRQAGAIAVRNRKSYFVNLISSLWPKTEHFTLLDIACGPCRDVAEALDLLSPRGGGANLGFIASIWILRPSLTQNIYFAIPRQM